MVGSDCFSHISIKKRPSYIESCDAFDNAIYSAPALDNATLDCFFLFQMIATPLITPLYIHFPLLLPQISTLPLKIYSVILMYKFFVQSKFFFLDPKYVILTPKKWFSFRIFLILNLSPIILTNFLRRSSV